MIFDRIKWYKRTALIYAVGAWTLLGSCVYYTFKGDAEGKSDSAINLLVSHLKTTNNNYRD